MARLTGIPGEAMIARNIAEAGFAGSRPGVLGEAFARALSLGESVETVTIGAAPEAHTVEILARRVEEGPDVCVVLVARDETEHYRLRAKMLETQRLEALGRLAVGVAHDYNNLLAGILGYVSLLRDMNVGNSEAVGYLATIESSARQAAELTSRLLAMSQPAEDRREPSILSFLVDEAIAVSRGTLSRRVSIDRKLARDVPPVMVSQCLLKQTLVNLILLARDATSDGTVTVSSRFEANLTARPESPAAGAVVIEISHRGHMPAVDQDALFQPFLPLPSGRDTGLALFASRSIVNSQGGSLDVRSERGTVCYTVKLPPYSA
jgi:hypothetical protein